MYNISFEFLSDNLLAFSFHAIMLIFLCTYALFVRVFMHRCNLSLQIPNYNPFAVSFAARRLTTRILEGSSFCNGSLNRGSAVQREPGQITRKDIVKRNGESRLAPEFRKLRPRVDSNNWKCDLVNITPEKPFVARSRAKNSTVFLPTD